MQTETEHRILESHAVLKQRRKRKRRRLNGVMLRGIAGPDPERVKMDAIERDTAGMEPSATIRMMLAVPR